MPLFGSWFCQFPGTWICTVCLARWRLFPKRQCKDIIIAFKNAEGMRKHNYLAHTCWRYWLFDMDPLLAQPPDPLSALLCLVRCSWRLPSVARIPCTPCPLASGWAWPMEGTRRRSESGKRSKPWFLSLSLLRQWLCPSMTTAPVGQEFLCGSRYHLALIM